MRFRKSGSRDFMNLIRNYRKCRRAFKRPPKWTTFFIKFHGNLDFSPKKQVEQRFLTIPHGSFRLCFALRMERSVDSHETIHFFLKLGALRKFPCIPPLNSPAFWAVQEITWPPRIHRFLGIEQKPRTRVTEFHADFLWNSEKSWFLWKIRFRRDANKAARCARRDF